MLIKLWRWFVKHASWFIIVGLILLRCPVVNATDSYTVSSPSEMAIINYGSTEAHSVTVSEIPQFNTLYYGYEGFGEAQRDVTFWRYTNWPTGTFDISFTIYSDVWTQLNIPFRVFVKNSETGTPTNCTTQSAANNGVNISGNSWGTQWTTGSQLILVTCDNVNVDSSNYSVYFGDSYKTYNSTIAISRIHLVNSAINSINDNIKDNTEAVNNINDSITDDEVDDSSLTTIQDTDIGNETETKLQDLITLPLKFWTAFVNAGSGNCSPYSLTLLNTSFALPCVDLSDYLGSAWNIIDIICSCSLFYYFAIKLKEIFVNLTSLQEVKEDLVQ